MYNCKCILEEEFFNLTKLIHNGYFFFVASRLGRYTSETKTTYTIEVQKLQLQGKLNNQKQGLLTDEERAAELDQLIEQVRGRE